MLLRFLIPRHRRSRGAARRWTSRALGGLGLLSSVACAEFDGHNGDWSQTRQAVIGGSLDEQDRYSGVVAVLADVSPSVPFCSGALIAPNLVLTALHCVSPLQDYDFSCSLAGQPIQHSPGAGELGAPAEPEQVTVIVGVVPDFDNPRARGKALFTTGSTQICRNDIALLLLDRELDLPLMPLRLDEPTVAGELMTVVGYGFSGDSLVARHFRSSVRVQDVGADSRGGPGGFAPPRTFVLGKSACPGDSGGPALAEGAPGEPIAGVYSIVAGDCTTDSARNVFTYLAPFRSLILEAFEASGHSPLVVAPALPDAGAEAGRPPATGRDSGSDSSCADACSGDHPTHASSTEETSSGPPSASRQRRLRSGCRFEPAASSGIPGAPLLTLLLGWMLARRRD